MAFSDLALLDGASTLAIWLGLSLWSFYLAWIVSTAEHERVSEVMRAERETQPLAPLSSLTAILLVAYLVSHDWDQKSLAAILLSLLPAALYWWRTSEMPRAKKIGLVQRLGVVVPGALFVAHWMASPVTTGPPQFRHYALLGLSLGAFFAAIIDRFIVASSTPAHARTTSLIGVTIASFLVAASAHYGLAQGRAVCFQDPNATIAIEGIDAIPITEPWSALAMTNVAVAVLAAQSCALRTMSSVEVHVAGLNLLVVWATALQLCIIWRRLNLRAVRFKGLMALWYRLLYENLATAFATALLASFLAAADSFLLLAVAADPDNPQLFSSLLWKYAQSDYEQVLGGFVFVYVTAGAGITAAIARYHDLVQEASVKRLTTIIRALTDHVVIVGHGDLGRQLLTDICAHQWAALKPRPLLIPSMVEPWLRMSDGVGIRSVDLSAMTLIANVVVVDSDPRHFATLHESPLGPAVGLVSVTVPRDEDVRVLVTRALPVFVPGICGDVGDVRVRNLTRTERSRLIISTVRNPSVSQSIHDLWHKYDTQAPRAKSPMFLVTHDDYLSRDRAFRQAALSRSSVVVPAARKAAAFAGRIRHAIQEVSGQARDAESIHVLVIADGEDLFHMLDFLKVGVARDFGEVDGPDEEPVGVAPGIRYAPFFSSRVKLGILSADSGLIAACRGGCIQYVESGGRQDTRPVDVPVTHAVHPLVGRIVSWDATPLPSVIGVYLASDDATRKNVFETINAVQALRTQRVPEYAPAIVALCTSSSQRDVLNSLYDYDRRVLRKRFACFPWYAVNHVREAADMYDGIISAITGISGESNIGSRREDKPGDPIEMNVCLRDGAGSYAEALLSLSYGGAIRWIDRARRQRRVPDWNTIACVAGFNGGVAFFRAECRLVAPAEVGRALDPVRSVTLLGDDGGVGACGSADTALPMFRSPELAMPGGDVDGDWVGELLEEERQAGCPEIRRCPFTSFKRWLIARHESSAGDASDLRSRYRGRETPEGGPAGHDAPNQRRSHSAGIVEIVISEALGPGTLAVSLKLLGFQFPQPPLGATTHKMVSLNAAFTYPCDNGVHAYDKVYGVVGGSGSRRRDREVNRMEDFVAGRSVPFDALFVRPTGDVGEWRRYLRAVVRMLNWGAQARESYFHARQLSFDDDDPVLFALVQVPMRDDSVAVELGDEELYALVAEIADRSGTWPREDLRRQPLLMHSHRLLWAARRALDERGVKISKV